LRDDQSPAHSDGDVAPKRTRQARQGPAINRRKSKADQGDAEKMMSPHRFSQHEHAQQDGADPGSGT
jgi:hypothetical protein